MQDDSFPLRGRMCARRYRLIATLGEGGMGTAYRAWDTKTGVPVVIKVPKPSLVCDAKALKRFTREIRTMAAVEHPHVVPIIDFGEDGADAFPGSPFVVMRFLPGGSLAQRRLRDADGVPLPNQPSTLSLWLPGIAAALDAVHAVGIVHRDVKPANIFFDGFWHSFLGDFGVAKLLNEAGLSGQEEALTGTSVGVGTPEFMSPEQFSPKAVVDGRSDQYALAVTVYEMLCGSKPFSGQTAHIAVEHLTLPPPPLASRCGGLPPSLCAAVHRGLAKRPAERFPSCVSFASAVLADVKPMELEQGVMRLLCPACGNILKLSPTAAGKMGKCPRCQNVMSVAKDLGSLWLEREAHGGATSATRSSGPISTLTPISGSTPLPKEGGSRDSPRVDPLVFRVAMAAIAIAALIVWQLLSSHAAAEKERAEASVADKIRAAREQAGFEWNRLVAENARLRSERDRFVEENRRLAAELAEANELLEKAAEGGKAAPAATQ